MSESWLRFHQPYHTSPPSRHQSIADRRRRRLAQACGESMISFGGVARMILDAELHPFAEAEHIMGMPALFKHRWTAADVRALMDERRHWPRYELLNGELLVTNAPTAAHQIAVTDLLVELKRYMDAEGIGIALIAPADIELAPENIMQPDVFVVSAEIAGEDPLSWPIVKALLLAVELLSPSTMREDRVLKRDFYLANHVDEYWIVDLDARIIERWTPDHDRPDIRRDELVWRPRGAKASFLLDVRAFFEQNRGLKRYF
jgi:Uma2 family endonuclease